MEGYSIIVNGLTIINAMDIPKTGDDSMIRLWSTTLGASTLALGAVLLVKRRKEEEEEE